MIDFNRSFVTWTIEWTAPDPMYKYPGGFVGTPGDTTTSRMQIDASCRIADESRGSVRTLYLTAPCRSEFIIASENLFQIPNSEFRAAGSDNFIVPIAKALSSVDEGTQRTPLGERFAEFAIDVHGHQQPEEAESADDIISATLGGASLNACSSYSDPKRGLTVTIEYPIKLINLHVAGSQFQVCTGAVVLPDLATWDGACVDRVFVGHASFTAKDHVEFILRREIELAEPELSWAGAVRGRDRFERQSGQADPSDWSRPRAAGYYETWELPAVNTVVWANSD